jgi:GNAT superfamily N-acetyltransferase
MSQLTTASKPDFRILDLERNLEEAIRFREDSFACSFGSDYPFQAEEYVTWLKDRVSRDPEFAVHVWLGDQLVGQMEIGQFKTDPTAGYINLYYLIPEMRGRGLSASLDEYAMQRFRIRGYKRALLSVSPTNGRALRYYQRQGWRDLGARPEAPEVHLMEKLVL